ncbi:hypothetical protein MRB53_037656 [Persea americana]|nr:hypothetical protein MRB53_037656 [Persea americana]
MLTSTVDERDLAKLISCVFQNALKFTEGGRVSLVAKVAGKELQISIIDTGPGIPESFRPRIFKPFSREDDSLTRQNEGLGLGLLVAKGLSRKLGGDLDLVRADTAGPNRGCVSAITPSRALLTLQEFAVRLPLLLHSPNSPRINARTLSIIGHATPMNMGKPFPNLESPSRHDRRLPLTCLLQQSRLYNIRIHPRRPRCLPLCRRLQRERVRHPQSLDKPRPRAGTSNSSFTRDLAARILLTSLWPTTTP